MALPFSPSYAACGIAAYQFFFNCPDILLMYWLKSTSVGVRISTKFSDELGARTSTLSGFSGTCSCARPTASPMMIERAVIVTILNASRVAEACFIDRNLALIQSLSSSLYTEKQTAELLPCFRPAKPLVYWFLSTSRKGQ